MKGDVSMNNQELEWYDDRVILNIDSVETENTTKVKEAGTNKPQDIYNYLNQKVWKQDEAKKAAAILVNNALEGRKQNMMFVGPTGCGKTHIFRCLQEKYPNIIEIVDASNITQEGWKGQKKWSTLLASPQFANNEHTILVLDEIDKMLAPQITSGGENTSLAIQSEALKIIEGTKVKINKENTEYTVDTSKISFVLCGAFSQKAHSIAEDMSGSSIGFGTSHDKVQAYSQKITAKDVVDFGAMPEFMGRIERVVNLEKMTDKDYQNLLTDCIHGPIQELEDTYKISIHISESKCEKLALEAAKSGFGIRGIKNMIRSELDNARFENYNLKDFSLE